MKQVAVKDLFVGEYFLEDPDMGMFHIYWEVIGHDHENREVIVKGPQGHKECVSFRKKNLPYEQLIWVRPEAPTRVRKEFLEDFVIYKKWPYDENGNFVFNPINWIEKLKNEYTKNNNR